MNTTTAKLGQLSMDVTDNMLTKFVLESLPPRFDHLKLTYSIQKHKWNLEDLTSLWAQEELQLFEVNFESANFASTSKLKKIKDCLHCRKPKSEEKYVFTGINTSVRVERFGTFRLPLNTGHFVYLIDTFGVPTFRRNLVYVSTLDKFGYTCTFENKKFVSSMKTILLVLGLYYSTVTYIVTPSNLILYTSMRGGKL